MELTFEGIKQRDEWTKAGFHLPGYDIKAVADKTIKNPIWIHFGCGNLFRAFQAKVADDLLSDGTLDRGIIAVEGFDGEIVDMACRPYNNLSILVTLKSDGSTEKTVIGSVAGTFVLSRDNTAETEQLRKMFSASSLMLASFTITEKGYVLYDKSGSPYPDVKYDFEQGPENPRSYLGKVASLLYARYKNGAVPIALVSMDNCSHNGDRLKSAVLDFAKEWERRGLTDNGFADYAADPKRVSYPWTMIDKITPRPDEKIEKLLEADGVKSIAPRVTSKNTYAAPFVNAEEFQCLVIEDSFPNGRPNIESGGIVFADRETVEKTERMKVCTCLNPLHTALAVFGCLLGYTLISEEMDNPVLKKLICGIGYDEGLPVVTDPEIINPNDFLKTVIEERLPNPFMPDSPQRIATDTSQKLAVRFGETIKAYGSRAKELKLIPLVLAGWIRYLTGTDDSGKAFAPSPDPLLDRIQSYIDGINIGTKIDEDRLQPLLSDVEIFGVDLFEVGLAEKVVRYFNQMNSHIGAVSETLKNLVG